MFPTEEFTEALLDELEAIRAKPHNEHFLTGGTRVGRVAGRWRYRFAVSDALTRVRDGSTARLQIGARSFECTLVSSDAHELFLSLDEDLGPSIAAECALGVDTMIFTEKLLARLAEIDQVANPAGRLALGLDPPSGAPAPYENDDLNPEQRDAVAHALGVTSTFIWGPPGTGKTRTIGFIGAEFVRADRRVLIVSHTRIAVDQAVLAVYDALGELPTPTTVLRVGRAADVRMEHHPEVLLTHHVELQEEDLAADLKDARSENSRTQRKLADAQRELDLADWAQVIGEWKATLTRLAAGIALLEERLASQQPTAMADRTRSAAEITDREIAAEEARTELEALLERAEAAERSDLASAAMSRIAQLEAGKWDELASEIATFQLRHGISHRDALSSTPKRGGGDPLEELRVAQRVIRSTASRCLEVPKMYGIVEVGETIDGETAASQLDELRRRIEGEFDGSPEQLRETREAVGLRSEETEARVRGLEQQLRKIELELLNGATVVGATLTAAYMTRIVLEQRFDTVIIDEASMAALPAIWTAAVLAQRAVVVGDFRQLAPIAIAETAPAIEWLRRDAFDVAGHMDAVDRGEPKAGMVQLLEQRRMAPMISRVPNRFIYSGELRDGPGVEDDSELDGWLAPGPWTGTEVLAVDLGDVGSFANSMKRRSRSRANVVSATTCMALVRSMLLDSRGPPERGSKQRILVASPYRLQADLIKTMIHSCDYSADVSAGTVHAFQGSEASVVILDLTAAPPGNKLRILSEAEDYDTRRLINVAMSRARRRLVVVGELEWLTKQAGEKTIVGSLVRHLVGEAVVVDAASVVGRVADNEPCVRGLWFAEGSASVLGVNEAIDTAAKSIVIFSPQLAEAEVSAIARRLEKRTGEIDVCVLTGDLHTPSSRRAEEALVRIGVKVFVKPHMTERAIVIDGNRVGIPTFQPLSGEASGTLGWWEGGTAGPLASGVLGADKLLDSIQRGGEVCPKCAAVMQLGEGGFEEEGRYWGCAECGTVVPLA